ncbi:hypothetical protein AVEN_115027-1 [Araneus ventricosus]|uniref:Tc1-like transposase DDE domain-containing protein n=1 Tax=Araneus ventricosus TaxID=182803 RepID=A0A4Y1ZWY7_ARAVE|nr:hypothetical protein AVEN_115027-1 [Araneus ventricosus]
MISESDHRMLDEIVSFKKKMTAELNQHLHIPLSTKKIGRELHKQRFYDTVTIPKPLLIDVNAKCRLKLCDLQVIITIENRVTGSDYGDTLANQLHPIVQTLLTSGNTVFQDDNCPNHTARSVKSWFKENEDEVTHLPWPPDHNIIELL